MWVPVQDKDTAAVRHAKDSKIMKPTTSRDKLRRIETQTANNSAEMRRNEIHAEMIDV